MKKTSDSPILHWWDWLAVILLLIMLHTLVSRLIITDWTDRLDLIRGLVWRGAFVGLGLGYSNFSRRRARWLSFFYLIILVPLQWTHLIEGPVKLEEKLLSLGGRLFFSFAEFFAQRPVDDPLFFIAIMSIFFWILSASAAYHLVRQQNFFTVVAPSFLGMLVIQNYDNAVKSRIWVLGFFALIVLLILGRLNFLQEQKKWKERRIFLSPENGLDLTSIMAISAGVIFLIAWLVPPTIFRVDTARQAWNKITRPWNNMSRRLENAVSALDSPSGGRPGEFFGAELELGRGFPLSDIVMITVRIPDLPPNQKPPRYYWRGKVYDYFAQDQWHTTGTTRQEFSPLNPVPATEESTAAPFVFNTGEQRFSLLYAPSQTIWISRPGSMLTAVSADQKEILSWNASPSLLPGETYTVRAVLSNPTIEQLREAGEDYPAWVKEKYLQVPEGFSQPVRDLAVEITANAVTPFDKASAITLYLRETIEYAPTIPDPPRNTDKLEWILFQYRKAYCVYYASAEILMLRSLGIPARMAVGFAQGTGISPGQTFGGRAEEIGINEYVVRKQNAHAWPEVYFPGIGWVEFEPTANQAPLDRPLELRDIDPLAGLINPPIDRNEDQAGQATPTPGPDENQIDSSASLINPLLSPAGLILTLIIFSSLAFFLSRRYSLTTRLPSMVRTTIERNGIEAPAWLFRWEHWVKLTSIEKSFESVNFALRQLGQPAPVHATPIERAESLVKILPGIAPKVEILLDEHQTSLYTSRSADARSAWRAAFQLRLQIIISRIRHYVTGSYSAKK